MTTEQIMSIRDAAQDRGDLELYALAWRALGYWRHPAFTPATPAEQAAAIERLRSFRA